jgi:hypothetical protein
MILIYLLLFLHPYHVSVCDVIVNREAKSIQVAQRIFVDDLEIALRKSSKDHAFHLFSDSSQVQKVLSAYVEAHFSLKINGTEASLVFLGYELEDDVLWCYLEAGLEDPLTSIEITNTLLFSTFRDQQNILHIKNGERKKSFILNTANNSATFQW